MIVPTNLWTEGMVKTGTKIGLDVLHGLGDTAHERAWLSGLILCIQRSITRKEAKRLGQRFLCAETMRSNGPGHQLLYARGDASTEVIL